MKEIFNKIYKDLVSKQLSWSNKSEVEFKAELLAPLVLQKKVILLGCGDFALGFSLAKSTSFISGMDFSEVAIEQARKDTCYDAEKMSLGVHDLKQDLSGSEGNWDVIVDDYLSHCLVDNREIYFKNVKSLMSPAGVHITLALTWPEGFSWPSHVADSLDPITKTQSINGVVGRVLKTADELLSELSISGFETLYSETIINPTGQPVFFSINKRR